MAITSGTAAILGGSSVLSGLLGGLFGSSSQKSANATNLQIARETNQQNRELFNQQLAWTEDMWNKSNAYNAPSNQVELLQKAGINPAAVYGSGSLSPASMPSAPSAPQLHGATVNPVDYSFIPQAIDNGINAYFNNQILSNQVTKGAADAQIAKVQAEFDARSMMDRLYRIANDSSKSDFERETARMELKFITETFDQRVMQSKQLTQIQAKQFDEVVNRIAESKLQQEAMKIANQYAPQLNDVQLKQYRASIANLYACARNQDAQALESVARKVLTDFQTEGVRLSNQEKESIMDALIDEAWSNADKAYYDAGNAAKQFSGGRIGYELPNSVGDPVNPSNRPLHSRSNNKHVVGSHSIRQKTRVR